MIGLFFALVTVFAIQSLPNADSGNAMCGSTEVTWDSQRSFTAGVDGSMSLRATAANGTLLLDLHQPLATGARLVPRWCGDVLADGSQALGYELFSGGAHCCFSETVLLLAPGARHLLDVDLGNGGLGLPQQLNDGGPLELVGSSDVFAYFGDLPFAASPFMPVIFAYDGTQYVESTRSFPDVLSTQIAAADEALTQARRPGKTPAALALQEEESIGLRLYALHLLLGDGDDAPRGIEARLSRPAAAWLETNAAAASQAIASTYSPQ